MSKISKNEAFDEIDNMLFDYYRSEKFECIPDIIANGFDTALYTNKLKQINIFEHIKQLIIAILSLLTLTGGVVFAKDIEHFFDNLFNNMNGVTTAINNGYISDSNMDYINSNDVNMKVTNVLMDDYNICLNFEIDLSNIKEVDLSTINSVYFKDLIILDENNDLIFYNNEEYLSKYCSDNNINISNNEYNSNISYYINNINLENNTCTLTCNLSRCNSSFPKSKKLFINSSVLELSKKGLKESNKININCTHNIGIDIPEKFYNRQALIYSIASSSNDNFTLNEATVYETGTKLSFNLKVDNEVINTEELNKARNELKNENHISENFSSQIETFFNPFSNIFLTDSNNKTYSISSTNSEDNVLKSNIKNYLTYNCTFDLTKFDATDTITLHFTYDNKERIIILEKGNY